MKNVVLWSPQVTVDYSYYVGRRLTELAREWSAHKDYFSKPENRAVLQAIATTGLSEDKKLAVDSAEEVEHARKRLDKSTKPDQRTIHVGGNPAISAVRAHCLSRGAGHHGLPAAFYVGLYPRSLDEYMTSKKGLATNDKKEKETLDEVFRGRFPIDQRPQTVAVESEQYKLIIGYGEGCTVDYLAGRDNFTAYLQKIQEIITDFKDGVGVVALSVPWGPRGKLDLGSQMIRSLKEMGRIKIFVGTSSFRRESQQPGPHTEEIYQKILRYADIVSLNETELDDLHTIVVGKGAHQDISRANRLKELPLEAIKICHSSDGAILDVGCDPETIINSDAFQDDPYNYLKEALQLSVDGATYAIDEPNVGSKANASMIRIYSGSIVDRTTQLFRTTFQQTIESLPGGIVAAAAPLVLQRRPGLTGVGAMFDGLLVSYLMRD